MSLFSLLGGFIPEVVKPVLDNHFFTHKMYELQGKIALITGSTSGIGIGIAKVFAEAKCKVIIIHGSRSENDAQEVISELKKIASSSTIDYIQADLSNRESTKSLVSTAIKRHGHLDILINNAGVQHVSSIHDFEESEWDRLISVNLTSCFVTMKEFLQYHRKKQKESGEKAWGRIVNISSVHGIVGSVQKSAYIASKHGLNGLTKVAALECAEDTDITVNAVCPGYVKTPLVEAQIYKRMEKDNVNYEQAKGNLLGEKQPSRKFTECEAIGHYCLFLCSEYGANINGAQQVVDGCWTTC